jgi:hypothetical protein
MEAESCTDLDTWQLIQEDSNLRSHRRESLKYLFIKGKVAPVLN